jgi:hypothetical protein
MAEINIIPIEVCKDLHENIVNNCWQKQDCGFAGEHPEIASISNIHTQEKEVVSISVINLAFVAAPREFFRGSNFFAVYACS